MADEIDRASEYEARYRELAAQTRKPEAPPARGSCLFCEAPLGPGLRWCDSDCRTDYEKSQRRGPHGH